MKIGLALPNGVPGATGELMIDWAVRAERAGFATLAATDRLVYPGHTPLLSLAAAAAVTSTIGLSTNVLIGPLRSPEVLMREAKTLSALAGGRLTLGIGPGVRDDDFAAAERDFGRRGQILDQQLELLSAAGVPLLVGGTSRAAMRRVIRYADGWTAPGLEPDQILPLAETVRKRWAEAGRTGSPRVVALLRFTLGEDAGPESDRFVRDYFAVLGAEAEDFVRKTPRTAREIRDLLSALRDGGVDEVVFHPTAARLSQVDRLADVVS
jgi:alkanesulfonate monooxygenase SsuD/methylene tetrahydromethanopterin reductase-like flavin-dependent oxidoreductase (luciferase family)